MKNFIFSTNAVLDTLPIRIGINVVFIAHGAQKLFGWFGQYGLALMVTSAALVVRGAGSISVDRLLMSRK